MEEVLLTGAGGSIGQMLAAHGDTLAPVRQSIRTRDDLLPPADPNCTLLLHLANIATDVGKNLRMHQKVAAAIEHTKIKQVVLPLSFSTLGDLSQAEPNPEAFNFGFRLTMTDPYPRGKLKVEEFWLNWQRQCPDRKLLLIYIPTIVGPHSSWTNDIARFAPDQVLVIPKLNRFFAILEVELVEIFREAFARGIEKNVERRLAVTMSGSLKEVISRDRNGPVEEVELPTAIRGLCGLAEKNRAVEKILSAQLKLLSKWMGVIAKRNVVPLSPKYIKLFLRQEATADRVQRAAFASPAMADRL